MDVNIRPIRPEDFEYVYTFINGLEACVFDREIQRAIFMENTSNPRNIYLVAEQNGLPVGFISCHIQNLLHHGGPIGEIQEMYVDPGYRSSGVGARLLDALKELAVRQKVIQLEVTSNHSRTSAHRFYEREHFVHTHKKLVFVPERG